MIETLLIILLSLLFSVIIAKVILTIKDIYDKIEMICNNIDVMDKGVSDLYDVLFGENDDDMKGYE